MPSRLIREGILTSDRVNKLSLRAEVFYRRLMSKVDDYGLFDARPAILRASLYPLRLSENISEQLKTTENDCLQMLAECIEAVLVIVFKDNGKLYLQMLDTKWKTRSEAKYPMPKLNGHQNGSDVISCKQLLTGVLLDVVVVGDGDVVGVEDDNASVPSLRSGTSTSFGLDILSKDKTTQVTRVNTLNNFKPVAIGLIAFLNEKTGRAYKPVEANIKPIMARLKEGFSEREVRQVIAKKAFEWGADPKMETYLRPKTLFRPENFANYAGELVVPDEVREAERAIEGEAVVMLEQSAGGDVDESF